MEKRQATLFSVLSAPKPMRGKVSDCEEVPDEQEEVDDLSESEIVDEDTNVADSQIASKTLDAITGVHYSAVLVKKILYFQIRISIKRIPHAHSFSPYCYLTLQRRARFVKMEESSIAAACKRKRRYILCGHCNRMVPSSTFYRHWERYFKVVTQRMSCHLLAPPSAHVTHAHFTEMQLFTKKKEMQL